MYEKTRTKQTVWESAVGGLQFGHHDLISICENAFCICNRKADTMEWIMMGHWEYGSVSVDDLVMSYTKINSMIFLLIFLTM